jgi:hypothetical protein
MGEKLKSFPLNSGKIQGILPTLIQHGTRNPSWISKAGEKNKRDSSGKRRSKIISIDR